ncbi:MAG: argininosuccinate synthase [Desulfobacterota bacterium]|nr:argininosuccinate synthase [Thermodesulfobacteriota bacterium]MDW8001360.1 argininosuccinate synthase [Deltaproteobacteria bacterium]
MDRIRKVVLAYSGGLDTSVILHWLKEKYDCEVIAYVADIGQEEDFQEIKEKALNTGAKKVYIEDLKEEFAKDFIFFAIKASAIYEGQYLLGTSIARPLIAKRQIEIARMENADAVAHGATGKGNDQVRFELTYYAFEPDIKVIAPWREWDFTSREELIEYAKKNKIPVSVTKEKPYSIDRNLMHISYEGGILEDPWLEPEEDMFLLTNSPEKAPDRPTYLEISFEDGTPVAIDGKKMSPYEIVSFLNKVGGENGVGRADVVENRFVGMKSRGVYETPGCTILHIAHRAVESITMDREVMHLRDSLIPKISELIYYGFWFSPEMECIKEFVESSQKGVTGIVRVKLYKGGCYVVGRKSEKSLYLKDLATFEKGKMYDQKDATGFIKLNSLRLRVRNLVNRGG